MGWVEQCWVTIPHTKHSWGIPTRICQGVIGRGDIYLPTEAEARGEVRASPAPTPTKEITCPNCGENNFYHRGWCNVDDRKVLLTEYERLRKLMQRPVPDLEAVIKKIEAKRETHRQSPAANSWYCNNLQCQVCATFEACLSALKELMEVLK
jgi:hypothetical protein